MSDFESALEWASSLTGSPAVVDANPQAQAALLSVHKASLASDAAHRTSASALEARAREYNLLTESLPPPPPLDEGALRDVDALAEVLSALQADCDDAVAVAASVARGWARDVAAARRAEAEAAVAERELRKAARRLAEAAREERLAEEEAAAARGEVDACVAKVTGMKAKARQYVEEVGVLREEVRGSGVSGDVTHEAVFGVGKEVQDMEERLAEVEKQLAEYHGLPAVRSSVIFLEDNSVFAAVVEDSSLCSSDFILASVWVFGPVLLCLLDSPGHGPSRAQAGREAARNQRARQGYHQRHQRNCIINVYPNRTPTSRESC